MTAEDYLANLKVGKYTAIGGARKALAKALLPATVKQTLAHAVDKHFASVARKSVAPAQSGIKLKKDGTPKGKPGRKPRSASVIPTAHLPKEAVLRSKRTPLLPPTRDEIMYGSGIRHELQPTSQVEVQINTIAHAIDGLQKAADLNKDFKVGPAASMAGRLLTHLLEKIGADLGLVEEHVAAPAPAYSEPPMFDQGVNAVNDTVERILGSNGLHAAG